MMENEAIIELVPPRAPAASGTGKVILVMGCAIGMLVGFSATYFSTLSSFLKPISTAFGWSRAETSAISCLGQLGLAFGAPVAGRLIERFGVHYIVLGSTVLFSLGMLALSASSGSVVLFCALSLWLGVVAVGTTPPGYLSALPAAFDRRLGLAMGVAMIGLGCGNALMPILVQRWIADAGWQIAYRYLAIVVLAGGMVATCLLARTTRPRSSRTARTGSGCHGASVGASPWQAIRTSRFLLLTVVFFVVSCAGLGGIVHMVPLLTDHGLSPNQASQVAALIGIGVMVGRAGTGALVDVIHARFVAAVEFLLGGAGLALIALSPNAPMALLCVGAVAFALTMGGEGDFMPFFVRRYFGVEHFSFLYGVLFFFFALGGVVGPVLFGWTFDHFGDYTIAYAGSACACVVCAGLVLGLGKYSHPARP
jgi:MFS family permease